jgi:hypothetical protein
VLALMHQKTCALLAVVLACLTIILVIECQGHGLPSEHEHAASTRHHHHHSAPGHTMGAIPCVLAVLPIGTLCLVFTSVRLHTMTALLPAAVPPLLPFVPPRQVAC